MKDRYIKMMEQLSLSDHAKENFACALEGEKKKRSYFPHIAAAAAVFALIAAALLLPRVDIAPVASAKDEPEHPIVINEYCSQEASSYDVVAQLRQYNISEFSDALQADIASGKVERAFDSREELEEYLGIELISAPDLEAAEIVPDLAEAYEYDFDVYRAQYEFAPQARYVVTGVTASGEPTPTPEVIKVSIHRVIRNTECYIDALILTEYAALNGTTVTVLGETFPALSGMHHDTWLDELGKYHIDTTHYKSALKDFQASDFEMPNGTMATIVKVTNICPICLDENCDGFREYYGHFVAEGILYSVLPFGIANPELDFPMHDTDSLSVLKTVLRMFE